MKIKETWRDVLPYVDKDTILIPPFPISITALNTDNIAVIDYYDYSRRVCNRRTFHFFVGPKPREVQWQELTDEQRLVVRTRVNIWTIRPLMGKYEDSRYYTLEALL